jgi:uncharacterized delta-60 repeat protein
MNTLRLAVLFPACCVFASTFLLRGQPGSLDVTFNPGTGADVAVNVISLQPDGKMLLAGSFTQFNGVTRKRFARLNTDDSLDTSFDPGDGISGGVTTLSSLALPNDGTLIIAGYFSAIDGVPCNSIARLRTDGSLDTSFNLTGISNASFNCVALQTNGQIVVGGGFTVAINGTNCNNVARLNSDGTLDTTFNPGTGANGSVKAIALQQDGKILIGGSFTSVNGTNCYGIVRLNPDGSMDTNFTFVPTLGSPDCITIQTNGAILMGGQFVNLNGYSRHGVVRLNADGTLDLGFNATIMTGSTIVSTIALQPDGKVISVGAFGYVNGVSGAYLVRLNSDGSLDNNFTPPATDPAITAVALQKTDGKILIGGSFTQVNGTNINRIARLNGDSPPSTTLNLLNPQIYFGMNLSGVVSNVYRIEYTSDLKIPSLWTPLINITLQTNPQFVLDTNPASGQRFYRAVQVSP